VLVEIDEGDVGTRAQRLEAAQGLAELADAEVGLGVDDSEPGGGQCLAYQARIVGRVLEQTVRLVGTVADHERDTLLRAGDARAGDQKKKPHCDPEQ